MIHYVYTHCNTRCKTIVHQNRNTHTQRVEISLSRRWKAVDTNEAHYLYILRYKYLSREYAKDKARYRCVDTGQAYKMYLLRYKISAQRYAQIHFVHRYLSCEPTELL